MVNGNDDNNCDDDFDNGNDMDHMDNGDGNTEQNTIDMPEMVSNLFLVAICMYLIFFIMNNIITHLHTVKTC